MAGLSQRDRSVLGRFGAFCAQEGLGPVAAVIEDQAVIEAFLALGCRALAPHSLGTYRSVLCAPGWNGVSLAGSVSRFCCPSPL